MDKSINIRDVLEKKVDERTKALSLSNKMLRQHIRERAGIEEALRNAQDQLEAELSSLNRLHELSTRLLNATDLASALKEILKAAIALCGADMGTIQLYDPARKILTIAAHQGFEQDFLDHFSEENAEGDAACGRALSTLKRVVIEDIQADERYAIHRDVAEKAGFRAVQSTPLCGRDATPLGMLTTHFRAPHAPSERELRMVDLYARQATDFIERLRITECLRDADRRKDELIATLSHELRNPSQRSIVRLCCWSRPVSTWSNANWPRG
ncbi:MAG: GAF domain-containing protein [Nitrosospira sp.]|nr:GAF domain-containing protein [Nitrosospira sp.]